MKKYIVVAFTLAKQPFEQILPVLEKLAEQNPDTILVHGFMQREVVNAKGFDTKVVDTLDRLFPTQKIFYNVDADRPDREALRDFAYNNQALVYVIGAIAGGVKQEVIMYIKAGIQPIFLPLDDPQQLEASLATAGKPENQLVDGTDGEESEADVLRRRLDGATSENDGLKNKYNAALNDIEILRGENTELLLTRDGLQEHVNRLEGEREQIRTNLAADLPLFGEWVLHNKKKGTAANPQKPISEADVEAWRTATAAK